MNVMIKKNYKIDLKPMTEDDLPFMLQVYSSTRENEMKRTGWDKNQTQEFLEMQFRLQHTHYQEYYPNAVFSVVTVNNEPVGRLYLHRGTRDIRIMDIALLKDFQGKKIGLKLMQNILEEGKEKNMPVNLHVEHNNPAVEFYKKLGFKIIEEKEVYYFMEWTP